MEQYYVCLTHGVAWMDKVSNMQEGYSYGPNCWIFDTEEQAEAKLEEINEEYSY